MEIYKDISAIPAEAKGQVILIGNFDGIHKGHQHLIKQAQSIAKKKNLNFGVLTFEPHPRKLFRPNDPPFRLTPENVKNRRLENIGVHFAATLEFDWDFASQGADAFIENVLDNGLAPQTIVVGHDFHFGQLRKGNTDTLRQAGYDVEIIDAVCFEDGERISSTQIRSALRHGHVDKANALLGWDWEIEGIVQRGDQRGRELGYPTANVHLSDTLHPSYGIYATLVQILDDGDTSPWLPSATNIGIRPMFEVPTGQVETFIFDFDRDIYDHTLRVRPVQRLRGEAKFDSLDDLIRQMDKDCKQAKEILKDYN